MENYRPINTIAVAREIKDVLESDLEGIELLVNEANVSEVLVVIDGPKDTPFENGKFKVKLTLPGNYPNEPPKGFFLTRIFHPNIAPADGEICVDTLKRDWKPNLGLKHILLTIRCLLIDPNPDSALNEEAGKLLNEQYSEYASQAKIFTDIYAKGHLKLQQSSVGDSSSSQASGVLRDNNGPSPTKDVQPIKKTVNAAKKALKRL